jgi:DNA-binding NarL/FixJ family response regulator
MQPGGWREAVVSEGAPVAICDPARSYRRGAGATLRDAGFAVEEPDDVESWASTRRDGAVLYTVRSACDWEHVRRLAESNPELKVVVLLVDSTPGRHAEALRVGAHGVVDWDADPERIVQTLRTALEGSTLLPTPVAQAMASGGLPLYDPEWITQEEVKWIRLLSQGLTIQEVAMQFGYSERAFYRLLHGLYGRMRVSNRTEAILQASRWGLLG